MKKEYHYVCSGELHEPIALRVISLTGYGRDCAFSGEMMLRIAVYCNRRRVGADVCTRYKSASTSHHSSNRELQTWNERLQLPLTYAEATADTLLHVTLWDVGASGIQPLFVAQASRPLFSKHYILHSGIVELRMQRPKPGQKPAAVFSEANAASKMPRTTDIDTYIKKEKLYNENYIERVSWLDPLTFSRLMDIKEAARTEDRSLYVSLEMPVIAETRAYHVLYYVADAIGADASAPVTPSRALLAATSARHFRLSDDPELGMENLCELKHHMMTRNQRAGDIDRRLQPNPLVRDKLEAIIRMPSLQPMLMEERDNIWKFRFWLTDNPHALTKFVRSVNWNAKLEVKQAIQVMSEWEPTDACDALELLGPSFTHPFVRRYAVWRLQTTPHATLRLYLPQLVQSLRYEQQALHARTTTACPEDDNLVNATTALTLDEAASATPDETDDHCAALIDRIFGGDVDMSSFLIDAACQNAAIANFLFWYLKVEIEINANVDVQMSQCYEGVMARLRAALAAGNSGARRALSTINAQLHFVSTLTRIATSTADKHSSRVKRQEHLRVQLANTPELNKLDCLALPLDPSICVSGVVAESAVLFASKLMPMKLTFSTVRGHVSPAARDEPYMTIFKRGDDLRQDQLVLQMIKLIDNILKEDKLDLCLTPYAVLATSKDDGFVQFVKATPIADLKSIQETLRAYRPSATGPYGIEADAIENYVRSCAGYSCICYVLGIGDRHMHNLLLCESGKMFHVDFGYILGRDPKPMPPPMKLTTEMINAMGGQSSEHFKKFIDYCTTGFLIIRRQAGLIINLFSLMLDAKIPDILVEKDKAAHTIMERFHLQLSEEDACKELNRVIQSSISARMPIISDFVHDVRQFMS